MLHNIDINFLAAVVFQICLMFSDACAPDGVVNKITLGKSTYVCITIGPLNWHKDSTAKYLRSSSTPITDDVARINIGNSWTNQNYSLDALITKLGQVNLNPNATSGVGVSISSMGVLSYQKAYRYKGRDKIGVTFPLMMAIINVEKGQVKSIVWDDDACSYCDPSFCAGNVYDFDGKLQESLGTTCWLRDQGCHFSRYSGRNVTTATNDLCELNVYVVWSGTDSNGIFFSSSSARFSLLSSAQLTEYTDNLKSEFIEIVRQKPISPSSAPVTPSPTSPSLSPSLLPTLVPHAATATPTATTVPSKSPTVSPSTVPSLHSLPPSSPPF